MNINQDHPENLQFDLDDLISIVLPVYNAGQFIEPCLLSISSQTHRMFEAIIVDDGSDDETPSILNRFASQDSRFKTIRFEQNRGIVAALNEGLAQSKGDWIARMDADDQMQPNRLQMQLDYLSSHPEIDLLGARIQLFRLEGSLSPGQLKYQNWSNSLLTDDQIKENFFAESPIMHPTFFAKRSLYEKLGGYQDPPWPEDYDFLFRAYLNGARFEKIPEVLVLKGDHPDRLARTDERCKRTAMFNAKIHYFQKLFPKILDRDLVIVGTGSAGKMVFEAFQKESVQIAAFMTHQIKGKKAEFKDVPIYTVSQDNPINQIKLDHPFYLLCIGFDEARDEVESLFQKSDLLPCRDYLRFI